MSLRPYRQKAVEEALHALARSGSAVLQMPTGAGKTKAATEIIANHGGIVWFVCHRREIERQAARAFREAGIEFGIVSPRSKPDYSKRVQIVLVGTLARRVADLPAPSLVIWDECHHVAAKSWAEIREALTDALHLGLTATPERFDGKGLREWFAELIPGPSIPDLIPEFLSTYSYFAPSSPDLTAARMQAGDYAKGDAAKIMNTPVLIGDAFREYREKADGKRALAFCVTREASKALVERFQAEGVPAVHIDANTKDDEREAAVDDLVAGRIKLISNVEVFTEGVDIPEIDAVILLRPTKSPTLFFQMVGRVLRKAEGKAGAVILDHAGLVEDHGRLNDPWTWSIDGGAAKARRKASAGFRKCPKCKFCPQEREPTCSACGYEYPTGREIGEFDGILREIRGEVPEGCETREDAARRWGVSRRTIGNWISNGMDHINRSPRIEQSQCFIAEVIEKRPPHGCESVSSFAERMGVSTSAVHHWFKRGMPRHGIFVPSALAEEWTRQNKTVPGPGSERPCDFARRFGVSNSCVTSWRRKGMPGDGVEVPVSAASAWVRQNVDLPLAQKIYRISLARSSGSGAGISDFARSLGVSEGAVRRWVRKGMPFNDGIVPVDEASKWLKIHVNLDKIKREQKLKSEPLDDGFIKVSEFAKYTGIASSKVFSWIRSGWIDGKRGSINRAQAYSFVQQYVDPATSGLPLSSLRMLRRTPGYVNRREFEDMIGARRQQAQGWVEKRGLPYDPKLGIPIQAGLEWVRDNRPDIVIPPEAWPTADNDNAAATKAA